MLNVGTVVEFKVDRKDLAFEAGDYGVIHDVKLSITTGQPVYIIKVGNKSLSLSDWNFRVKQNEKHVFKHTKDDYSPQFCFQRMSDGKLCAMRSNNLIHRADPNKLLQWLNS